MKVYFYSAKNNINSYFLLDERSKEGILIDPTTINEHFINKIETKECKLILALLTNAHTKEINDGISNLKTLYDFQVYSPSSIRSYENAKNLQKTAKICNKLNLSSFCIECFSIRYSHKNIHIYKIGNAIFTGIVFLDSILAIKTSSFVDEITYKRIKDLLYSFDEASFLFPLSGPPITIKAMKFYSNL